MIKKIMCFTIIIKKHNIGCIRFFTFFIYITEYTTTLKQNGKCGDLKKFKTPKYCLLQLLGATTNYV